MKCLFTTAILSLICSAAVAQPLNPQQKQQALDTFQSMGIASAAVNSMNPDTTPGQIGQDAASQLFVKMSDLLKANCKATTTQSPPNAPSNDKSFLVNGAGCPVSYSFLSKDSQQGSGTETTDYKVGSASYKALNDVDALNEVVNMKMTPGGNNTFKIAINGKGSLHSQKLGQIPLAMTGTGSLSMSGDSSMTLDMTATSGGLVVDLKAVQKGSQDSSVTTYYLNGVQLTDQEVSTYLNLPFAPVENLNRLMNFIGAK